MTTLSDKIRAFMLENEKELVETGAHAYLEDMLVDIAQQEKDDNDYPDSREIALTIAEVRYENREM